MLYSLYSEPSKINYLSINKYLRINTLHFNTYSIRNILGIRPLGFTLFFTALLFACNDKNTEIIQEKPVDKDVLYGISSIEFPKLTSAASDQLLNWGVYNDFLKEVKSINGSKYSELQGKTERLVTFVDSMAKVVPDTLRTMPILTRMKVVDTRSNLLYQEVKKFKLDSAALQMNISEMNNAAFNLIAQINEKFKKDDIDFEQREGEANELKKQQKFLDSVRLSELEDQKKQ